MGEMLLERGTEYFNPDIATRQILLANPGISQNDANSRAWHEGKNLLEEAIALGRFLAFETTLGGNTITNLLENAALQDIGISVWYVGLKDVELHIQRVRSRVASGGHDIPEQRIRERYSQSRLNLIRLLPRLEDLLLYDNSEEADHRTRVPSPKLVLKVVRGRINRILPLEEIPEWAKPIVAAALQLGK